MLILPFYEKTDWKSPPLATLALIALCTFIYFFAQNDDNRKFRAALSYYLQSGLAATEYPEYVGYLRSQGKQQKADRLVVMNRTPAGRLKIFITVISDAKFQERLASYQVIQRNDARFETWHARHVHFRYLFRKILSHRYGLVPAQASLFNRVSYMFLHGSAQHLLVNMIFLLIAGFAVEKTLGRGLFVACYLLTGIVAGEFYVLADSENPVPTIGASGAISGIMAMYTVLFGLRKINYFVWAFFYFDYFRAPAILLLPFWIGLELWQMMTNQFSQVNYLAHLGGLVSGALLATLLLFFRIRINTGFLDQEQVQQQRRNRLHEGMEHLGNLDYEQAKTVFRELLDEEPNNPELLEQYCIVLQQLPPDNEYHEVVHAILAANADDPATAKKHQQCYHHYLSRTGMQARLRPELLTHLVKKFCRFGLLVDAESILLTFLEDRPDWHDLPGLLYLFANANCKRQRLDKAREYTGLIQHRYPGSDAATHAQTLEQHLGNLPLQSEAS